MRVIGLWIVTLAAAIMILACDHDGKGGETHPSQADAEAAQLIDSALAHIDSNNLQEAMLLLKEAEKLLPQMKSAKRQYQICQYIGWVNESSGAHHLAMQYQKKALEYAKADGAPQRILDVLLNQANTFYNIGQPDSAWVVTQQARQYYDSADNSQKSTIIKNVAHHEMMLDSLNQAADHAYQAALLAEDDAALGNALALLCRIFLIQGKEQQAEVLMTTIPDHGGMIMEQNKLLIECELQQKKGDYQAAVGTYKKLLAFNDSLRTAQPDVQMVSLQNQYDQEVLKRQNAEQRLYFAIAFIALLITAFAVTVWSTRRHAKWYQQYRDNIRSVNTQLHERETTIGQLKTDIDRRMEEMGRLREQLSTFASKAKKRDIEEMYGSVAETKDGVDVLYALVTKQNVSQFGKKEETALMRVLEALNRPLANNLMAAQAALTPKETFYCVMECYGLSEDDKAEAFHCSPQALRSTKSRLTKKIQLEKLHD